MPHKHSQKIPASVYNAEVAHFTSKFDELSMTVADLVSTVGSMAQTQTSILQRLERLEHIYVFVDFVKLEYAADHILHGDDCFDVGGKSGCNDLPVIGERPDRSTEQQGAPFDDFCDVFHLLGGMVRDSDTIMHERGCLVDCVCTVANDRDDGVTSSVQDQLARRAASDAIVALARDVWTACEPIGQVGSLVVLGCKGHLGVGTLVECLQNDHVILKGFGGQTYATATRVLEVRSSGYGGIILEDIADEPIVDKFGCRVYGHLAAPGGTFRIFGHTR